MSRMLRSDDTSPWVGGYLSGRHGSATLSGAYGNNNGGYIGSFLGYATATTGTVNAGWVGAYACFIHQSREGGSGPGYGEFNYILSMSGGTAQFAYPLQYSYTNNLAQIILINEYSTVTLNGLTVPAWNGATNGIGVIWANQEIVISSASAAGAGYRGGNYWNGVPNTAKTGGSGESYTNVVNQYGGGYSGGAGGVVSPDPGTSTTAAIPGRGSRGQDKSGSGCGGAHAAAGENGIMCSNTSTPNWTAPTGPVAYGDGELRTIYFGGGGAEGGSGNDDFGLGGGNGGAGGGILICVAPKIRVVGALSANGNNGGVNSNNPNQCSGGGGGAGGSILLKGAFIELGAGYVTALGGAGGAATAPYAANGASGANGRIHIDYGYSLSGSSSPSYSARQDGILAQMMAFGGVV